jgi:hypothetical protein
MAIPESQLETWANIGAVATSAAAYSSVKAALEHSRSSVKAFDYEVYLQGSYRNKTNIYGDSDVDIVVQLNSTFGRDLSSLPPDQEAAYHRSVSIATYDWSDFKRDVLTSLQSYYGSSAVVSGNRAIKVKIGSNRITADVVPALQYRRYHYFYSRDRQSFTEGIKFHDLDGNTIINYPKAHIANGEAKNSSNRTDGWYKPTVRVFKNARSRLVGDGVISSSVAPSYFVECIVYNAPDTVFGTNYQQTLSAVLNYLCTLQFNRFVCQNEQVTLFGPSTAQWNSDDATAYLQGLVGLWNNWY